MNAPITNRVPVEMLAPYKGRVYDPYCGSAGMFVQWEKSSKSMAGAGERAEGTLESPANIPDGPSGQGPAMRIANFFLVLLWLGVVVQAWGDEHALLPGIRHASRSEEADVPLYALRRATDLDIVKGLARDEFFGPRLQKLIESNKPDEVEVGMRVIAAIGHADSVTIDVVIRRSNEESSPGEATTTALASLKSSTSARDELRRILTGQEKNAMRFYDSTRWHEALAAVAEQRTLEVAEIGSLLEESQRVPTVPEPGAVIEERTLIDYDVRALVLAVGTYGTAATKYAELLATILSESPADVDQRNRDGFRNDGLQEACARSLVSMGSASIPHLERLLNIKDNPSCKYWATRALIALHDSSDRVLSRVLQDNEFAGTAEFVQALVRPILKPSTQASIRADILRQMRQPVQQQEQSSYVSLTPLEQFLTITSSLRFSDDLLWIGRELGDLVTRPAVEALSGDLKELAALCLERFCLRYTNGDDAISDRSDLFLDALVGIAACGVTKAPESLESALKKTMEPKKAAEAGILRETSQPSFSQLLLVAALFQVKVETSIDLVRYYRPSRERSLRGESQLSDPSLFNFVQASSLALSAWIVAKSDPSIVEELEKLLESEDIAELVSNYETKQFAYLTLGLMRGKGKNAALKLCKTLERDLGQAFPNSPKPTEARLSFDSTLLWAVAQMPEVSVDYLLPLTANADLGIRWGAMTALGWVEGPAPRVDEKLVEILRAAANLRSFRTREDSFVAAVALSRRGNPVCVPQLIELLSYIAPAARVNRNDPNSDPQTPPEKWHERDDVSPFLATVASESLGRLGPKAVASDSKELPTLELLKAASVYDGIAGYRRERQTAASEAWRAIGQLAIVKASEAKVLQSEIDRFRYREERTGQHREDYWHNQSIDERVEIAIRVLVKSPGPIALAGMLRHQEGGIRARAADELDLHAPFEGGTVIELLEATLRNQSDRSRGRLKFYSYLVNPADLTSKGNDQFQAVPDLQAYLNWVDAIAPAQARVEESDRPAKRSATETKTRISQLLWFHHQAGLRAADALAEWAAQQINVEILRGQVNDQDLLKHIIETIGSSHPHYVEKARNELARLERVEKNRQWGWGIVLAVVGHLSIWGVFLVAYPHVPFVRAFFFWNPWVRKIVGLAYVDFLLAWVPPLRRRLFLPFRGELLADAQLGGMDADGQLDPKAPKDAYYADLRVRDSRTNLILRADDALVDRFGRVTLVGESGLGKTMIARNYVRQTRRLTAFLNARRCSQGVVEAISQLLEGKAADIEYLKQLVYAGAFDLVIDGFNEVDPATREKIRTFISKQASANVLLTTQPLGRDEIPAKMTQLVVQPLSGNEIEGFLQKCDVDPTIVQDRPTFVRQCQEFSKRLRESAINDEQGREISRILSNPMDLTIVAELVARGESNLDLLRLQEQLFRSADADYRRATGVEFPLDLFSEAVYQMRLANRKEFLVAAEFAREVTVLKGRKIMLERSIKLASGETATTWSFRHDKITDFFIFNTFEKSTERCREHLDDSRFKGVYLMLATRLSPEAATALREEVIRYAVESQDTTLLAPFEHYLERRQWMAT